MKVNKRLENISDTCFYAGFACCIFQFTTLLMKTRLVKEMGSTNYTLFMLCFGILACGFYVSAMIFQHLSWRTVKHKIIGWTLYDRNEKQWEDAHPEASEDEWADIEQTIVDEIRRKKYKFGGNWHQYGATGCPVMEDGTVVMVSMRHWGDIMSRVWGGNYCDYAWTSDQGDGYKVPKPVAGFANKVKWMTDKEIEERERKIEEARKQAEVEHQKHLKEQQDAKAKEHKANMAFATKYVAKFLKDRGLKANVDVANAVAELLVKCHDGTKDPGCKSLRWIFDPTYRKRLENERSKRLKVAFENFRKVLEEHDAEKLDQKEDK